MAVAFDSVAAPVFGFPPIGVTVPHSLVSAAGTDRIVIAVTQAIGPAPHTFTTTTYNGVAMNFIAQTSPTIFGRETTVTLHYLLDADLPASPGVYNYNFVATNAYGSFSSVIAYTGVSQVAPGSAQSQNSNNPPLSGAFSTNITPSNAPGLLVGFGGGEPTGVGQSAAPGAGQTERLDVSDSDEFLYISDKPFTTAALNSMSFTPVLTYFTMGQIVAELLESGGGNQNPIAFGANF